MYIYIYIYINFLNEVASNAFEGALFRKILPPQQESACCISYVK